MHEFIGARNNTKSKSEDPMLFESESFVVYKVYDATPWFIRPYNKTHRENLKVLTVGTTPTYSPHAYKTRQ